jgi:hypothetical protein
MSTFASRVGRWPLAFIVAALAACADEPVGVRTMPKLTPHASVDGYVTVTTASGGTEVGSLRWAAVQAAGGDVINFDPSLAGATITLQAGIDVPGYVIIRAPTDKGITISGDDRFRVIRALGGVALENVTITKGNAAFESGSAIWTDGFVGLMNSTVRDNRGYGAAIHGGLTIGLNNSTVSGNTGTYPASGVEYGWRGAVVLDNSTVAHNLPGPGIAPFGYQPDPYPPTVMLRNSIISNNGNPLKNCQFANHIQAQGMNISNDYSCGYSTGMFVGDPLLAGLADNGGPTETESFSYLSPALNSGLNCDFTVDQRYVARDTYCDIGAFEFTDFTLVTIAIDANATVNTTSGAAVVTGTVKCSPRAGDQFGLRVELKQQQKVGRTTTVVQGTGFAAVNCTTSAQSWSAPVTPSSGVFQNGDAVSTVSTNDPPIWVKAASTSRTVKLARHK